MTQPSTPSTVPPSPITAPYDDHPDPQYQRETHCPSCGKFVGVFERCPYCQTVTRKRLSIRLAKIFSLLTSTVGLVLLLFYARSVKTPEIRIAQIGPLQNFAHVRVVGTVERSFGLHPKWRSLAFVLQQIGTGDEKPASIRVNAYSQVAEEIAKSQREPQVGDLVEVEGQVRYQKDNISLLINSPKHLTIKTAAAPAGEKAAALAPGAVTTAMLKRLVTIEATVARVNTMNWGTMISLEEAENGLVVWLTTAVTEALPTLPAVGARIRAKGRVKEYKGRLEIEVDRVESLTVLAAGDGGSGGDTGTAPPDARGTTAPVQPPDSDTGTDTGTTGNPGAGADAGTPPRFCTVAEISRALRGTRVVLEAKVTAIKPFQPGTQVHVADGDQNLMVWVPSDVLGKLAGLPEVGQTVKVVGVVDEFKGELQVRVQAPEGLGVAP